MNVVKAEGRKPCLVVDSSVCNTNSACVVNEASVGSPQLSPKAAHKTVRVRESDRGLLGIQMQVPGQALRLFFYKVCPFGAVFSASWFQRVSGFLVQVLRQLFWVRHALLMYADDPGH